VGCERFPLLSSAQDLALSLIEVVRGYRILGRSPRKQLQNGKFLSNRKTTEVNSPDSFRAAVIARCFSVVFFETLSIDPNVNSW